MSSRIESKEPQAEKVTKQMAQNRRNILRLGALGAVAVLTANVMPGSDVRAATDQAGTRAVAKQGAQKVLHAPPAGKTARKAAPMKSQGELATRKPGSSAARVTKRSATKAATKSAKSAEGERQAGTRMTAKTLAKKTAKVMAQ
jgi:hypothetical protein